ncbi:MAG: hypothetical protein LBF87_08295, partial [Treponema sp.]|nr:hypothetical protein [Treponema sp.]
KRQAKGGDILQRTLKNKEGKASRQLIQTLIPFKLQSPTARAASIGRGLCVSVRNKRRGACVVLRSAPCCIRLSKI